MFRLLTIAFCACVTVSLVPAQTAATLTPAQTEQLSALADKVKAALANGDLKTAQRLSTELSQGIFRIVKAATPTPQEQLHTLETTPPSGPAAFYYSLQKLALTAFDAGDYDKAEQYGRQLLALSTSAFPPGLGVFYGNLIVGRVALRRDHNVALSKTSLLAAGASTGSPTLNSFGPNMSLAKDLIEAGERGVVLEYFTLCGNFWKSGQQKLDNWTAMVRGGGMPDFGGNLIY